MRAASGVRRYPLHHIRYVLLAYEQRYASRAAFAASLAAMPFYLGALAVTFGVWVAALAGAAPSFALRASSMLNALCIVFGLATVCAAAVELAEMQDVGEIYYSQAALALAMVEATVNVAFSLVFIAFAVLTLGKLREFARSHGAAYAALMAMTRDLIGSLTVCIVALLLRMAFLALSVWSLWHDVFDEHDGADNHHNGGEGGNEHPPPPPPIGIPGAKIRRYGITWFMCADLFPRVAPILVLLAVISPKLAPAPCHPCDFLSCSRYPSPAARAQARSNER